jgi:hypothetical protein
MDMRGSWESRELWPKAPPKSVFLLEATDVVGRAMWGHDWSLPPFDDLPEEIGGPSPQASRFDITITRIATACEKGEIAVIFETEDAERVQLPTYVWRWFEKEMWRSRFINGRDEIVVIDGRDETIFSADDALRWLFVRRTDLERFIKSIQALKDSAASAIAFNRRLPGPPSRGGRRKADSRRDEELLSAFKQQKSENPQLSNREIVRRLHGIEAKNEKGIRAFMQRLRDAAKRAERDAKAQKREESRRRVAE